MEDQKTVAKKKVGNKTTEIIIGTAAMKLASGIANLNSAVEAASKINDVLQEGTLKVTDLEDKIGSLETDLQNKKAQNKIDLQLDYDSNKEAFANKFLQEKGLVSINATELNDLKADNAKLKQDQAQEIQKAVSAAVATANAAATNAAKIAELEHKNSEAENKAKITQLEDKVKFYAEQVESWKGALEAEREAGVERAKAGAIGTLNVGNKQ